MHVVLFGGSFNPPHLGHTLVIEQAFELIPHVDEVWLVPDYHHTFAKEKDFVSANHRLAMCELLTEPTNKLSSFNSTDSVNSLLNVSYSRPAVRIPLKSQKRPGDEIPGSTFANNMSAAPVPKDRSRQGPSLDTFLGKQESIDNFGGTPKNKQVVRIETYNLDHQTSGDSIITIRALKQLYPEHHYSFLMGSDNLKTFHKWGSWQSLLEEIPFYIYPRAGFPMKPLYQNMTPLEHPLQIVTNISSTIARNRLQSGLNVHNFIPEPILKYIHTHKLYQAFRDTP